jgi:hypothetical protein
MPALSFAPARSAAMAATWATRRLRRRRRTRREAIGAWWRNNAPIPKVAAAAAAGIGTGGVLLIAFRRRAAHLRNRAAGAMLEMRPNQTAPDNDQTLADKVRTEIFRRPDAPKGAVNVSAVDGIVYLRGEVSTSEEIQRLVDDTLAVSGVLRVESMLHTPGRPAPTGGAG